MSQIVGDDDLIWTNRTRQAELFHPSPMTSLDPQIVPREGVQSKRQQKQQQAMSQSISMISPETLMTMLAENHEIDGFFTINGASFKIDKCQVRR